MNVFYRTSIAGEQNCTAMTAFANIASQNRLLLAQRCCSSTRTNPHATSLQSAVFQRPTRIRLLMCPHLHHSQQGEFLFGNLTIPLGIVFTHQSNRCLALQSPQGHHHHHSSCSSKNAKGTNSQRPPSLAVFAFLSSEGSPGVAADSSAAARASSTLAIYSSTNASVGVSLSASSVNLTG